VESKAWITWSSTATTKEPRRRLLLGDGARKLAGGV
jgi:hypothetical protein